MLSHTFVTKAENQEANGLDSVEISLITCAPHEEIYSLYGHSALRYHDLRTGQDLAFNYGVFNFNAPHFVLRFVFGLTDYELGVLPFKQFCEYYRHWGSQVDEQVLNLTANDKRRIANALAVNLRPENRVYRYNFFYDNCSTRPRNIIEDYLDGEIIYHPRPGYQPSYRQMIHEKNAHHPWAAFGNDMLLGMKADTHTSFRQQEFLPENLMYDFGRASISTNGKLRPLVKEHRIIVNAGQQTVQKEFPLSPTASALLLAFVFAIILVWEHQRQACLVWFDAFIMLLLGLAGCIVFVMLFSHHPSTSSNLQVLIFNPLHLFFIRPIVRHDYHTRYWLILLTLICLFLVGSLVQDYAEGVEILALSLLSRYWSHRKHDQ